MQWATTASIALALCVQVANGGYVPDWDEDSTGPSTMSTTNNNNNIRQSYSGISSAPAPVPVGKLLSHAAPTPPTVAAGDIYSNGDSNDDDSDHDSGDDDDSDSTKSPGDAPSTSAPAAVGLTTRPLTHAPSPVMTPVASLSATSNNSNDDDDSDDTPTQAPALYGIKPYEPNGNYNDAKQSTGGKQPQTPSAGSDTKPNVTNGGVNLFPYARELRDYIVETHNWARGALVPSSAANMRQLEWDESLAIEASELVDTCVFDHDTENYAYGQNLMYGGSVLDNDAVDSWFDAWVANELSPYDRSGTGFMDLDHASAVLWATSHLVGCASKMCAKGYLTACNYYTPGNMRGERAYIPGPSCSQCPPSAPFCDATGKLCTANPTGATPTTRPDQSPVQRPVQTAAAPAIAPPRTSVPAPKPGQAVMPPAKLVPSGGGGAAAPAPTPAKTTTSISPKVVPTPLPTPAHTLPHELCV